MLRIHTESTSRVSMLPPVTRATPRAATGGSGDILDLSPTAQLFLNARQTLSALPAVRPERVQEMQSLLASGRYHVNGETCAEAMLSAEEAEAGA